jgi:hypothetical protein
MAPDPYDILFITGIGHKPLVDAHEISKRDHCLCTLTLWRLSHTAPFPWQASNEGPPVPEEQYQERF